MNCFQGLVSSPCGSFAEASQLILSHESKSLQKVKVNEQIKRTKSKITSGFYKSVNALTELYILQN